SRGARKSGQIAGGQRSREAREQEPEAPPVVRARRDAHGGRPAAVQGAARQHGGSAGRLDHEPPPPEARRAAATSRRHCAIGRAGKPATVMPSGTSLVTPALAATETWSPRRRWPATEAAPPMRTLCPTTVEPAMPDWEAIMAPSPRRTLWAIWTWLSSLQPLPTHVGWSTPAAMTVLAQIG